LHPLSCCCIANVCHATVARDTCDCIQKVRQNQQHLLGLP
jgi:hypothetical protein